MSTARSIALVVPLALAVVHCSGGSHANDAGDASPPRDVATTDAPVAQLDGGDATAPSTDATPPPPTDATAPPVDAQPAGTLAAAHPCDRGIATDPAVLWAEAFEEANVAAITARYDAANDPAGMSLVTDVAAGSCGHASLRLVAGGSANATDLYKRLPDQDELYVRWYAKYQPGIQWHHSGVWFGGYHPSLAYPFPMAGLRPNGDDRISISIEPIYNVGMANPRFDTYDYWMGMHSWMPMPSGSTAYYGNSVIHAQDFTVDEGQWNCLEVHVRLNTDPTSSAGAVFDVWKNDALVQHFDEHTPTGCWIADKFCAAGADATECTAYPSLCTIPYVPLNQQWRSTTSLKLNYFWPQNYITSGPDGALEFDDMVVATQRIGCRR